MTGSNRATAAPGPGPSLTHAVAVDVPETLRADLPHLLPEVFGTGPVAWSAHRSLHEANLWARHRPDAIDGGIDLVVVRHDTSSPWPTGVLLSSLRARVRGRAVEVVLLAEGPRSALPVWICDYPRLRVLRAVEPARESGTSNRDPGWQVEVIDPEHGARRPR